MCHSVVVDLAARLATGARLAFFLVMSTGPPPGDTLAFLEVRLVRDVTSSVGVVLLDPLVVWPGSRPVAIKVVSLPDHFVPTSSTPPYEKLMVPEASSWLSSSASEPYDLQQSRRRPAASDIGHKDLAVRVNPWMNCHGVSFPSTKACLGRCPSLQGLSSQVATYGPAALTVRHLPQASSW